MTGQDLTSADIETSQETQEQLSGQLHKQIDGNWYDAHWVKIPLLILNPLFFCVHNWTIFQNDGKMNHQNIKSNLA